MTHYKQKYLLAQSRVDEYRDDFEVVLSERCATDEKHCGCVPILRADIAAKEKEISCYQNALILITSLNGFYPEKTALADQVMEIIHAAISGDCQRYLNYDLQGNRYCKWGVVEKDIRAVLINSKTSLSVENDDLGKDGE